MDEFFTGVFIITIIFVLGMAAGHALDRPIDTQADEAIRHCEESLARDKKCKLIITAEVEEDE